MRPCPVTGPSRKDRTAHAIASALLILIAAAAPPAARAAVEVADGKLKLYGDVRFRAERDWDSTRPDGSRRDDRDRIRGRFRLGFLYEGEEGLSLGARIRSGARSVPSVADGDTDIQESAQSPNESYGDNFEPKGINLDKLFVKFAADHAWAWGGKNAFPFRTRNELFWDGDVTPEGIAGGADVALGESGRVYFTGGAFILGDSGTSADISLQARLLGLQISAESGTAGVVVRGAIGFFDFVEAKEGTPSALNGLDYGLLVASAEVAFPDLGRSVVIGADLMRNVEDYESVVRYSPTPFTPDEKTGYVLSATLGQITQPGDVVFSYTFAHIERYAVVPVFAQDDWLRWGNATQTRSSNFEGHELRGVYALAPNADLVARFYSVDGIELLSADAAAREGGKRFRVDIDARF